MSPVPVITLAVSNEFVLRGVRHVITDVTSTAVKYRAATATRTPYTTTHAAFLSLVSADIILMVG